MPGSLFDTNIWIAAVFPTHPFHGVAQTALKNANPENPAFFCRATQQSFLRLASTPVLHKAYGAEGLTNRDALLTMQSLRALPQVGERDEPPGVVAMWQQLATRDTASPKLWMDAYLAAFAICGGLRMVSLDRDFQKFTPQGLDFRSDPE